MANETPTATTTPEVTPVVAPTETAPAVTPVETPTTTPVAAETPTETLLTEAMKKDSTPVAAEPTKVEETKAEAKTEEKPKEGGQSDEPAPPPTYEPFTLPEGMTLEQERVTEFTNLLSDLEVKGKADHALVQEFGQKAVDFHIKELQRQQDAITDLYKTAWDKQKTDWKEAFLKDPEMGGNRAMTTIDSAKQFIRTHGGTPEQQAEFVSVMESSGLGNHPAVIRILANAGRAMKEPGPLPAKSPVAPPKSKTATLYGQQS